jgi:serine protease Do
MKLTTTCALLLLSAVTGGAAEEAPRPENAQPITASISQEVKSIFARYSRAVVKIKATDKHGELSGTGFFIDPTGTLYTAYSVGGDADNVMVEFNGKRYPARQLVTDVRSGIAMLKIDAATPSLPVGRSELVEIATPVLTIGFPLDLPQTPSFGMVAGFDRKYRGRYFATTHLRVNLPTQRGEAGAPLVNFRGEVVGIVVSSLENSSSCYALPIDAAEKIRRDYVRYGEVRHGWVGINVAEAREPIENSTAQMTDIMAGTPAAECGAKPGDILVQVGSTKVDEPEDVLDASFFITAGETIPVTVVRGSEKLTFEVETTIHPAAKAPVAASTLSPPQTPQAIPLRLQPVGEVDPSRIP